MLHFICSKRTAKKGVTLMLKFCFIVFAALIGYFIALNTKKKKKN